MNSSGEKSTHNLSLEGRNACTITGVSEVLMSDGEQIELMTEKDKLLIKGQGLSIITLDVQGGVLRFQGTVDAICYLKPVMRTGFCLIGKKRKD
jgi:sporulation protein YabP